MQNIKDIMDTFITTVMVIYDNINKEKEQGPRLINNKITEKQFLAYYIYRIWIKYRKLMEDVNTPTDVKQILLYMEIPKKYHDIYLTYPMADKMPINEKQLDLIILSMLKHLNQSYKIYGPRIDGSGSIPPHSKDYKMLTKYLTGKTIENIIQDVIQIKLLVPNLSRPANVRNIWDGIDQMLDDIDVIEPQLLSTENPATEIPDTKLIKSEQNSNISETPISETPISGTPISETPIPKATSSMSNISDSDIIPIKVNSVSSSTNISGSQNKTTNKQNIINSSSKSLANSNITQIRNNTSINKKTIKPTVNNKTPSIITSSKTANNKKSSSM